MIHDFFYATSIVIFHRVEAVYKIHPRHSFCKRAPRKNVVGLPQKSCPALIIEGTDFEECTKGSKTRLLSMFYALILKYIGGPRTFGLVDGLQKALVSRTHSTTGFFGGNRQTKRARMRVRAFYPRFGKMRLAYL